jgi:hypothetical protein
VSEASAQAIGDRAAAIIGSNNVVFTGDIYAGAEKAGADLLLLARAVEATRPRCDRRAAPTTTPPQPYADCIDREDIVESVRRALGAGGAVNLHGDEGAGKTYVIRAAIEGAAGPDGVVWIEAAGRPVGDALQGVFESLYDAHPRIATPEQRRSLFAGINAVVVFDEATHEGAQQIRTELADSTIALVTRTRAEWGPALDAPLEGLAPEHAFELLTRRVASARDDPAAARRLIALLRGNPRRLLQAATVATKLRLPVSQLVAALEADPDSELRRLLWRSLDHDDRRVLEVLVGACDATLAAERLRALSGVDDAAQRLWRMEGEGIVQSGSPRYRLAGAMRGLDVAGSQERVARDLIAAATARQADIRPLTADLPAAMGILRWARHRGRSDIVTALGRAVAPAALYGRWWETWGEILTTVRDAAGGDRAARAWALHHLGTRAYLLGDRDAALSMLREALALRRDLPVREGAADTQHNLDFIDPPSPPAPADGGDGAPPRPGQRRWLPVIAAIIVAAGVGAAALASRDDNEHGTVADRVGGTSSSQTDTKGKSKQPGDTTKPTVTIDTPARGATYREGKVPDADFRCDDNQRVANCRGTLDGRRAIASGSPLAGSVGDHTLTVVARDAAGHTSSKQHPYSVSTARPTRVVITISAPEQRDYEAQDLPLVDFACTSDLPVTCAATLKREDAPGAVKVKDGARLPTDTGNYTLTVTAMRDGKPVGTSPRHFSVVQKFTLTIGYQPEKGAEKLKRVVAGPNGAPPDFTCPGPCSGRYTKGTSVAITAQARDSTQNQWSDVVPVWGRDGPCAGTKGATCTITIDADKNVVVARIPSIPG